MTIFSIEVNCSVYLAVNKSALSSNSEISLLNPNNLSLIFVLDFSKDPEAESVEVNKSESLSTKLFP